MQQVALRDLDRAFTNFFAGRAGYPTFKRRNDRVLSFAVRDLKVVRLNRKWGTVLVPKLGQVRFRISRSWASITASTSARISFRNNQWHVSFTTGPAPKIVANTGRATGIDRGVANTLALSDGTMLQAPTLTLAEQNRYLALERTLARQNTHARRTRNWDSARRRSTLNKLGRLRQRLDNRRRDWIEQTTTDLSRTHDLVAVEDLNIRSMTRSNAGTINHPGTNVTAQSRLNRAILSNCWGTVITRLNDKLPAESLIKVNPRNTSRTCTVCRHVAKENRESQAVFTCQSCGHTAHADTNAAINILNTALTTAAGHAVTGRISLANTSSVNQPAN